MDKPLLRITLYAAVIYLTAGCLASAVASPTPLWGDGMHSHGRGDFKGQDNRNYARTFAANLNVGEPRTVRLIYFTPNDWSYRADVVQKMKDTIRTVQTFYAEQMKAHGYGKVTFRIETDSQGEPMVHHVVGGHPFSYYDNTLGSVVIEDLEQTFDFNANIYFIVLGTDALRQGNGQPAGGVGYRWGKNGGVLLVPNEFSWGTVVHELGHTFGLNHDFRDGEYIMSYGPGWSRLSACAAEFLFVHSYFNPDTPIEEEQPPTIKLISPRTYPPAATSIPVRVQVSDSDGLHQVLLHAIGALQICRNFTGEKDAIVEFEYDGGFGQDGFMSFSSTATYPIAVDIVDTDGNISNTFFYPVEISPHHIATLSGHTDWVQSIAFSPDGTILASGARDRTVRLWDVEMRTNIAVLQLASSVSFSLDGTILASGDPNGVKLWDVATQQSIATLNGHFSTSVSFSPDGTILASGAQDQTVKLWDVATRKIIATLRHEDLVESIAFSPDGTILASGAWHGTIKLWDMVTLQNITTLEGHRFIVAAVSFSLDSTILASGSLDKTVKLWDMATRQNIATFVESDWVYSVSFSPDGATLASGTGFGVNLWEVATRQNIATVGHTSPVASVSFSPDGTILASGTAEGTVELWDTSGWMQPRPETVTKIDITEIGILDSNLRAAIELALGAAPGAPIVQGHLENLPHLQARNANISTLTGLERAISLTSLDLGHEFVRDTQRNSNSVSDLSPLSGLTNLTSLRLELNNISDISAVANLTGLTELWLWDNSISDISAVTGLTNLRELVLDSNSVSDLSPLSGLTNLTSLRLGLNNISDISAVANLTGLTGLWLWDNNISDLSPLVANAGLGSGDIVDVWGNPLSYASIHVHIPALQSRGIDVQFDAGATRSPDVNSDGFVNVLDLVLIASSFGPSEQSHADVNRDGVVNILDVVLVAGMFEDVAAAPSAQPQVPETLTAVEVQGWLTSARSLEVKDPIMKRGFVVLEQLLYALTPKETLLLANYPNPFNPETWIPYTLAEDAAVEIAIYDVQGVRVRRFDVGYQRAGYYTDKGKAVYWDGRNAHGESVASGVYFYHLRAGDDSQLRRLVILK